ncbi:MAG: NAD(+) synthase [Clostridiales bacterium]|nr:NAD(+) synthase [Clostridiales bacterium]
MAFAAEKVRDEIVAWIRDWFALNGSGCRAVVGVSGGKDSTVVAALCTLALGRPNVVGVILPNGEQADMADALCTVAHLGILHCVINIREAYDGILDELTAWIPVSAQTRLNLPPRLRMSALYAVAQSMTGRVANTCNLSEDWVGYSTRYGDSVGDFSPLSNLTATEVKQLGYALGLPKLLIDKPPADGLTGKTDEEVLGFSYETLDRYIRENIEPEPDVKRRINELHEANKFKLRLMESFPYTPA